MDGREKNNANQLLRENNQAAGKTWVYSYDNAGNILSRAEYEYTEAANPGTAQGTVSYGYGDSAWGDLLTSYGGTAVSSDAIGNITGITVDGASWVYTWEHGRQLKTAASGGTTWTYSYDANGMRTSRSSSSGTYNYVYNGSKLTRLTKGSDTLYFAYDASGPMSVTYNGTTYYYVLNLQGDVTAILNSNGAVVVEYTYDAWGKLLSTDGDLANTLGAINPLRYRGYVCDQETELYYLQTRYYNPTIGRFISADAFVSTGQGQLGCNMFAYCLNSPIRNIDVSGGACYDQLSTQYGDGCAHSNGSLAPSAKTQEKGMINGQGTLLYSDDAIGLGTWRNSGCAFIAVYNMHQLLGETISLQEVFEDFFWNYGTIALGAGGTGPIEIGDYLRGHNINYKGYLGVSALERNVKEGDIIILTVMNNKDNIMHGFHTVTCQYIGGQYIIYNSSNNTGTVKFDSIMGWCEGGVFIYGFCISNGS